MSSIRSAKALAAGAVLAAGALLVPAAAPALRLALAGATPESVVAYRLHQVPPATYLEAIGRALTAEDPHLAASLVAVADERKIPLPAELRAKVDAAQAFDAGRTLRETWAGFRGGDVSSPAALTGAVTADLTGVGDVRDLVKHGGAYLDNEPYDPLTLGLAATGLTITVATLASLGSMTPARAGLTALKASARAGTLRPPMRRALTALAGDVVDRPALTRAVTLLRQGEISAARQTATRSLRAVPLQTLRRAATDLGDIASAQGYRAAHDALRLADGPQDVSRMAHLAGRLGPRFRGALALLGAGALSTAGLITTLATWLASFVIWALVALYVVARLVKVVYRFLRGRASREAGGGPPAPPIRASS